jgi:hypothetical protein
VRGIDRCWPPLEVAKAASRWTLRITSGRTPSHLLGSECWPSEAGQVLRLLFAFPVCSFTSTLSCQYGHRNGTFLSNLAFLLPHVEYRDSPHLLFNVSGAMIRLPASTITLGPSDLKDFESRQRRCRSLQAGDTSGDTKERRPLQRTLTIQTVSSRLSGTDLENHGEEEPLSPGSPGSSAAVGVEYSTFTDLTEDQDGNPSVGHRHSPENVSIEVQRSPPPSKDEFHYGGFVESPTQQPEDDASQRSSPFGALAICQIMD